MAMRSSRGGPYGRFGGTLVETSGCGADGCYTLTVYDSFGDGMCCAYGYWRL